MFKCYHIALNTLHRRRKYKTVQHTDVLESNSPLMVVGGFLKFIAEPLLFRLSEMNDDGQKFIELYQAVKDSGMYNFESCRISLHTKLNISFFRFMLSAY